MCWTLEPMSHCLAILRYREEKKERKGGDYITKIFIVTETVSLFIINYVFEVVISFILTLCGFQSVLFFYLLILGVLGSTEKAETFILNLSTSCLLMFSHVYVVQLLEIAQVPDEHVSSGSFLSYCFNMHLYLLLY